MMRTIKGSAGWAMVAVVLAGVAGALWFIYQPKSTVPTRSETTQPMARHVASPAPSEELPEIAIALSSDEVERLQLKFAKVREASVGSEVRVPGTVQPNTYKQVHLSAIAGGIVRQVTAELGQTVKRGDTVAEIFSSDLTGAQTAYRTFNAELELEHKKLQRTEELVRLGAASKQELEEVESSHQVHIAHVEEARQRLVLLGLNDPQIANVAAGKVVNPNIAVPSPLDGIVTARTANAGQVVGAGQDLLTVTSLSSVWVEANVLENDFAAVRIGSRARITTPAYPGREYRGAVEYIDPSVDPQTRTAKVRIAVDNPGLMLRLGMYMDVLFTSPSKVTAPVVPKEAIQSVGVRNVVYVTVDAEPGRFVQRTIKTGEEASSGVRVIEGLKPGETVVTAGSFLLRAEALRQHAQ